MWVQATTGEAVNLSRFSVISLVTFDANSETQDEVEIYKDDFEDPEGWMTIVDVQVGINEDGEATFLTLASFDKRSEAKAYIAELITKLNDE